MFHGGCILLHEYRINSSDLIIDRIFLSFAQSYLTSVGLFSVGIAFILAVGICSLIGVPYGPIHTSLPFLLLGLGVDDIFVFHAFWKQIHADELNLSKSLTERIALTLSLSGSAITVTSFTDIVAFIIGATTVRIELIITIYRRMHNIYHIMADLRI